MEKITLTFFLLAMVCLLIGLAAITYDISKGLGIGVTIAFTVLVVTFILTFPK